MPIDLNKLRDIVRENQTRGDARPSDPGRQVMVDREGNVRLGNDPANAGPTTVVPQETFAHGCGDARR